MKIFGFGSPVTIQEQRGTRAAIEVSVSFRKKFMNQVNPMLSNFQARNVKNEDLRWDKFLQI
jgi:hypothetical protein